MSKGICKSIYRFRRLLDIPRYAILTKGKKYTERKMFLKNTMQSRKFTVTEHKTYTKHRVRLGLLGESSACLLKLEIQFIRAARRACSSSLFLRLFLYRDLNFLSLPLLLARSLRW